MAEKGIRRELSGNYSQYQNSVERSVQEVIKGTSALLHGQEWLRPSFWNYAVKHMADCMNAWPSTLTPNSSPRLLLTEREVNVKRSFKFYFGQPVLVNLPDVEVSWRFDTKNDVGLYMGDKEGTVDSHYIYWPASHTISARNNVTAVPISTPAMAEWYLKRHNMRTGATPLISLADAIVDFTTMGLLEEAAPPEDKDSDTDCDQALPIATSNMEDAANPIKPPWVKPGQYGLVRAGKRRVRYSVDVITPRTRGQAAKQQALASNLFDLEDNSSINTALLKRRVAKWPDRHMQLRSEQHVSAQFARMIRVGATKVRTADTPTVKKAMQNPDADQWRIAIKAEINMLLTRGTLIPVDMVPPDSKIIHSTTPLRIKRNQKTLQVDKYKARCCARGDMLAGEVELTYSPTISSLAFDTVSAIAVHDQMSMCTIDTVGAYLYQDYPADLPPLYLKLEPATADACDLPPSQVYRVGKYLYGLPDAGRAYYLAYSNHLIANGYRRSSSDPCLFIKTNGQSRTYVMIHVDDTFVATTDNQEISLIKEILQQKFEITSDDDIDQYLGVAMERLADGSLLLRQPKLLAQLEDEYATVLPSTKAREPMSRSQPLIASEDMTSAEMVDKTTYLHLLGTLMYLQRSRPDIGAALSFAATFAAKPTRRAYNELLHLLKYLLDTREKTSTGLVSHYNIQLHTFYRNNNIQSHSVHKHFKNCFPARNLASTTDLLDATYQTDPAGNVSAIKCAFAL